jgi:hypothetical protein
VNFGCVADVSEDNAASILKVSLGCECGWVTQAGDLRDTRWNRKATNWPRQISKVHWE